MIKPLPRVKKIAEFQEEYFLREQAVVVEGAARSSASSRWTIGHLAEVLASQRPTVRLPSGKLAHMNMPDFFRYLQRSDEVTSSHGPLYLADFYLKPSFGDAERARLAREAEYPLIEAGEWPVWKGRHTGWNTLYAGAAGTFSRLHQDSFSMHSWLAEIAGTKLWRLCPPDAVTEEVGFKTKAFDDANLPCDFFEAVLAPGDVMYIPPNWWHAVQNQTVTLALTGNFCTLEQAHTSFAEVQAMPDSSERDVWMKTWECALGEHRAEQGGRS